MAWFKRDSKPSNKGTKEEERARYRQIEEDSDWILHIRELRRAEFTRFMRDAVNPAVKYLLFHDNQYIGDYSVTKKIDIVSAIFNEYLLYEVDAKRKSLKFTSTENFPYTASKPFLDIPVADHYDKSTTVEIEMQVDVEDAHDLIEKGIWNIHAAVREQIETLIRQVSSNYRVAANAECESELHNRLKNFNFDFGIRVIAVTPRRIVPAWLIQQIELERQRQRQLQEEEEKYQREAENRRRQVREEDELYARQIQRENAEEKRKRERQQYYMGILKKDGIKGLQALILTEPEQSKEQLKAFIESIETKEREQRQADELREDKNREFEIKISQMEHEQRRDFLDIMASNDLLRPDILLQDPSSRQAVNNVLGAVANSMSDSGNSATEPRKKEDEGHMLGSGSHRQLGAGKLRRWEEDDKQEESTPRARPRSRTGRKENSATDGEVSEPQRGKPNLGGDDDN